MRGLEKLREVDIHARHQDTVPVTDLAEFLSQHYPTVRMTMIENRLMLSLENSNQQFARLFFCREPVNALFDPRVIVPIDPQARPLVTMPPATSLHLTREDSCITSKGRWMLG